MFGAFSIYFMNTSFYKYKISLRHIANRKSTKIFSFWIILSMFFILLNTCAFGRIPFRILPCIVKQMDRFPYLERECIVHFAPGIPAGEKTRVYLRYGLNEIYHSPYGGFDRVIIPPNFQVVEMIRLLKGDPAVLHAEPNCLAKSHLIPNDPLFQYQWNMLQIQADQAWNLTNGAGIIIAVLDSGIAFENFGIFAQAPDLAGTIFIPGWDFVNNDANPDDDYGHGTHITGTIAQTTNNSLGCAGVAFGASIMPVKVLDNTGYGSLTNVVDGIYFAANNGAKILNMSFGFGNNPSLTLQNAIEYANIAECLLVCSAGNQGTNLPSYPASYLPCISVSATIYDKTLASYSNYGIDIDLCAPGGDLSLDQNLDGYPDGILQQSHDGVDFTVFDYFSGKGTSWSAALVTGVAAMVTSIGGITMTPLEIRSVLESSALDLGIPGWDESFGWGLVNAAASLIAAQQGATVLSTSPLVPLSPINQVTFPLPVAILAGYSIPFSPIREGQNLSPLLEPAHRMSFTPYYTPELQMQRLWPKSIYQAPIEWRLSNPYYPGIFPYFPIYSPFVRIGGKWKF
jgi:serine protease